jgi:hypothetical protein
MRKRIKTLLMFLVVGLTVTAIAGEKIYDPMDVFKRDVPPNILVVVDNSGSMSGADTDNHSISSYIDYRTIYPGLSNVSMYYNRGCYNRVSPFGSYWAYNMSGEYGVLNFSEKASASHVTNTTKTFNVTVNTTGNISFVSLDMMFDDVDDAVDNLSGITSIKLIHPSGREVDIMDLIVGKYNQTLNNVVYANGNSRDRDSWRDPYIYHKTLHLAIGGAPVDDATATADQKYFRGLPKNGTWQVKVTHSGSDDLYIRAIRIDVNPKLDKNTTMKSVLEDVFRQARSARFAFGSYKTYWSNRYSEVLPDRGTANIYARYAGSGDTAYHGAEILEGFPSDPLATESNKADIIDWVNMDVNRSNASEWSHYANPKPKEIFAVTYTPIGGTFRDINNDLGPIINGDPSGECRNYSVIYLTDGYCTVGTCTTSYIAGKIDDIYRMHTVNKDLNGDGTINGDDFIPTPSYIIGFAMGTNSSTLNAYAAAGHTDGNPNLSGNQAYMPSDADSLLQVFKDAIAAASTQTFTGETQVIPVKLDPDLQNKKDSNGKPYLVWQDRVEDGIVQSYFTYSNGDGFKGHLKTYGILKPDGTLLDNNRYRPLWDVSNWSEIPRDDQGLPLSATPVDRRGTIDERIDHIEAYIAPDSTEANYVGSAAAKVPFRESFRCIVTPSSGSNGSALVYLNQYVYNHQVHRYLPSSQLINFVMGQTGIQTAAEAIEFIDFLQTKTMGDSTFSTPAIIGAPDSFYPDDTYKTFVSSHKNRQKVIYIGANDGMLHCLDAHTGDEMWAFIPYDIFPRLMDVFNGFKSTGDLSGQPDPKGASTDPLGRKPHYYYLASSSRYTDIKDGQGNWMTILSIGEGGGGNAYTTLNVTSPEITGFDGDGNFYPGNDSVTPADAMDNPSRISLAYTIDNGSNLYLWSTASSAQFSDMGETWSTPSYTRYDKDNFVGYFGSGYPGFGGSGGTLYAVNLSNGDKLDEKSITSGRSIMCSPGALVGGDNTVYAIYFGDTAGGLWRYVPNPNGIGSLGSSHMDKIFQSIYNTTIFDTPALLLDSNGVVWISTGEMGSEAGANVVDDSVLYTVKDDAGYDQHPAPVYTSADMVDMNAFEAANGVNTVVGRDDVMGPDDKGYFFQLPVRETLFTSPIITGYTLNQLAYTTTLYLTYRYPQQGNYCSLGESNLYIFGLASMFIADEEGDNNGANLVGEGKPGSPFESEAGDIWLNTPSGPVRVVNAQGEGLGTGSASQDVDAQTLGKSGGWYTK